MPDAPLLVVMGVSGSGKSTVGALLAAALGCPFIDGDDLHPAANRAKMAAGIPLDDADRAPWLARIVQTLDEWRQAGRGGVVACSALKRAYREALGADDVRFIYLEESPGSVRGRLGRRRGHFMPASLIDSQFAALETPQPGEPVILAPAAKSARIRCRRILAALDQNPSVEF
jgi:gluconokinase